MRRPVVSYALATLTALILPCASQAQRSDYAPFVPRIVASAGYSFIYANDPPGGDHKFEIDGAFVSLDYNTRHWFGISGEVTGGSSRSDNLLNRDLDLYTYTGGPRFTFRRGRYSIFGQVLFGRAEGTHSYFPTPTSYTTSATAFAVSDGGGIDYHLNHRYGIRGDVRFLHTTFDNGVNTSQNQLEFNLGLAMKFGGHYINPRPRPAKYPQAQPLPAPLPPPAPAPEPAPAPVAPPPAAEIAPPAPAPAPPAPVVAPPIDTPPVSAKDDGVHPPVDDIYFDYDKADLREDTWQSFRAATLYLQTHPGQRLLLGGYSDERGTMEFNMELGEKRANNVREAMIHTGANPDQITVVTYGKGAQVCTTPAEPCYQRNRRVAFMWLR